MEYEEIKKLIEDMGDSKIDSLEIEFPEGTKISMKKNQTVVKEVMQEIAPVVYEKEVTIEAKQEGKTKEEIKEDCKIIESPMVGTFYASPSPKEPAFVKVGDKVSKGTVLCVVEAMKLMNEIESEVDGEIVEICVNNESLVEYGTPLFKIK